MNATTTMKRVLAEQDVPAHKAEAMAKSVWRGLTLIVVGLALLGGSFAMVYFLVIKLGKEPGLITGALILGTAGLGVLMLVGGSNAMSGQALDAAADSPIFGLVAKGIRLWRAKPPAAP